MKVGRLEGLPSGFTTINYDLGNHWCGILKKHVLLTCLWSEVSVSIFDLTSLWSGLLMRPFDLGRLGAGARRIHWDLEFDWWGFLLLHFGLGSF